MLFCHLLHANQDSTQRSVHRCTDVVKLMLGAVLTANTAIALGNPSDVESAYNQGIAAVEEHRYGLALQHFQRAAEQGHREAQNITGLMLLYGPRLYGSEIQSNSTQSRHWLEQAAKQGSEVSMAVLKRVKEPN